MKLEKSLQFWIHHNEAIIQWLVVGILVITALWLIRMLTDKSKPEAQAASADFSEIEATLKKLLDRASAVVATPASPTLEQAYAKSAGTVGSPDPALKAELEKREKEIAELKNQLSSIPKADPAQFIAKITELETKLAEYEILEDDIADLSLYKEENVRLKQELGKIKGGDVSAEAVPEVAAAAPEPEPALTAEDVFPEFPTPGEPVPDKNENLVAEFEQAVKQVATPPPPPAPTPEPASAPVQPMATTPASPAPAPAAAAPSGEIDTDDILAEFAGEGLDTDKMLAEIESLNQVGAADSSALEEASDISKMAEEASKLGS